MMMWEEWAEFSEDERNWRNHEEKGLLKIGHVRDFMLRLWFEEEKDVSIYELDFHPLFVDRNPDGVVEALRDQERFSLVKDDYALVWLNPLTGQYDEKAINIAPECIRFFTEKYGRKVKVASNHQQPKMMAA